MYVYDSAMILRALSTDTGNSAIKHSGFGLKNPDPTVRKANPSKRIVLLLNKIDLVPKESVEKWLTYLREEMPTVKCNTQEQRTKRGWKSSKLDKTSNVPQSSDCLGNENLIKLLKNYSRSHEFKLAITVGIVGIPNAGKSNRSRVVNVGSTPGVTRSMQEVQLDKKVKLLDCPGVVMLKSSNSGVSVALRNCKRVEKMDDPISPVKEILNLCPHETLLSLYKVPSFTSVDDFLQKVATLRGKLKKGGIVVVEAEEGWVQCDKCECWQHQICSLFNVRRNGEGEAEYTCHNCYVQEIKHGLCMSLPESALLGVKDFPRAVLSDHIEERLLKRHRDERQDRAKLPQKVLMRFLEQTDSWTELFHQWTRNWKN